MTHSRGHVCSGEGEGGGGVAASPHIISKSSVLRSGYGQWEGDRYDVFV